MHTSPNHHRIISFRNVVILAVFTLLCHMALIAFWQDYESRAVLNSILLLGEGLAATAALFYAARRSNIHSRRLRLAWGLVALGQLSWMLGDVAWMIIEFSVGPPTGPSVADALYLVYYPLLIAGIIYLPAMRFVPGERLKVLLDMSIVMLAATLIFWTFLFAPIAATAGEAKMAMMMYPVSDLVLLWALTRLLFRQVDTPEQGPSLLLAASVAASVFTNGFFAYHAIHGTYVGAGWLDVGWAVSYLLAGLAGVLQTCTVQPIAPLPSSDREPRRSTWPHYLPYAWLVAVYFLLVHSHDYPQSVTFSTLGAGVGTVIGLVLVRQVLALEENTRLYVLAQQEIGERKRAEESLRNYTIDLQARNEELDAFAHTVAHDLKNPLGLIVGCAEELWHSYADMADDERQQFLQVIARNGRKMDNIIEELLLLSGVRKMQVQLAPLDMADIVTHAQERLVDMIRDYKARVITPQTWPAAIGYAPWVEEVWTNYLSNALKYGGRPPQVELGGEMQPDGMVRFWVVDNGAEIAPEVQNRLFTPFTQLAQANPTGHGLGLSIVRRIIDRLGGQVGVDHPTAPGREKVFYFTLPGTQVQHF